MVLENLPWLRNWTWSMNQWSTRPVRAPRPVRWADQPHRGVSSICASICCVVLGGCRFVKQSGTRPKQCVAHLGGNWTESKPWTENEKAGLSGKCATSERMEPMGIGQKREPNASQLHPLRSWTLSNHPCPLSPGHEPGNVSPFRRWKMSPAMDFRRDFRHVSPCRTAANPVEVERCMHEWDQGPGRTADYPRALMPYDALACLGLDLPCWWRGDSKSLQSCLILLLV